VAGGGIERTFADTAPETREALRVLWRTDAFTPHAIAVHPRVDAALAARLGEVMVALADDATGRALLAAVQFDGLEPAADGDWDDVRALGIDLLEAPGGGVP
jgi:phosphonate transport system substrate-binding protein